MRDTIACLPALRRRPGRLLASFRRPGTERAPARSGRADRRERRRILLPLADRSRRRPFPRAGGRARGRFHSHDRRAANPGRGQIPFAHRVCRHQGPSQLHREERLQRPVRRSGHADRRPPNRRSPPRLPPDDALSLAAATRRPPCLVSGISYLAAGVEA